VDRAGDEYEEPTFILPTWAFATNPAFLSSADQVRFGYIRASGCDVPTPGSTASVVEPLEPLAWYEVFIRARSTEPAFKNGRLDGVTFRTSRWRTPEDMLAGIGFASAGHDAAPVSAGDVEVTQAPGLAVALGDDQGFQGALETLGLKSWPVADGPRVTYLWTAAADGSWPFAGLLVESPEPVSRPERVNVTAVTVKTAAGNDEPLNLVRRDASASRLLYLANNPVAIAAAGSDVTFRFDSILDGATTPLVATRPVSGSPSYAREP
jgi:hypothetical protein